MVHAAGDSRSGMSTGFGGTTRRGPAAAETVLMERALGSTGSGLLKLGFGALLGWCVGYTLKKLGKAAALVVGIDLLTLQALVRAGYLEVHWRKLASDFTPTRARLRQLWKAFVAFATYNLPFAATFVVGVIVGFSSG